jgi:PIN domain nuclease of toxin-antitoxin system
VNLLLDTHIWLWSLLEPARLSKKVRRVLEDPASVIWLSPVSAWEAMLLIGKGRVQVDGDAEAWVRRAITEAGLREAPMTCEVAIASATLRLAQRDPADRFIAATAKVFNLTLVTADRQLTGSKQFPVLMNR